MRTLIISRDSLLHAEIAAQGSARLPALQLTGSRQGLRDAVDRVLHEAPELVIFDASDVEPGEAELVDRLARHYPDASFILLTREPQQELLIRAMRAGMREVLPLPLMHRAFHEAMDRIEIEAGITRDARWQGAGLHRLQGRQRRHLPLHQPSATRWPRWAKRRCC
jgi:pilus assembly protein CpaE